MDYIRDRLCSLCLVARFAPIRPVERRLTVLLRSVGVVSYVVGWFYAGIVQLGLYDQLRRSIQQRIAPLHPVRPEVLLLVWQAAEEGLATDRHGCTQINNRSIRVHPCESVAQIGFFRRSNE